jgi:hypothetical protein
MPNPTCQLPKGAGARMAGLNMLLFWDLIFGESVLTAVLHQCGKNDFLNRFPHSLFIEIPSRDSLLARTDINTQDRQESAVGVVSAVNACHCETVLDSTGYRCRPPGPLLPLEARVPRAVAAAAGGGRRRSARQEQSACRNSRDNCLHEASGQACCR